MDVDLEKRKQMKSDPAAEKAALGWISQVVGNTVNSVDDLQTGAILCDLANKIKPGSVKKINKMSAAFFQMENIENYVKFCAAYGVPQPELFVVVDLFEKKNIPQVVQNIYALARTAQKNGFEGPTLGPKLADKFERTGPASPSSANTVPLLEAKMAEQPKPDTRSISREVVKTSTPSSSTSSNAVPLLTAAQGQQAKPDTRSNAREVVKQSFS